MKKNIKTSLIVFGLENVLIYISYNTIIDFNDVDMKIYLCQKVIFSVVNLTFEGK